MLRMFARRNSQRTVAPGTDVAAFGLSLPSDSVVNDIRVKMMFSGTDMNFGTTVAYAVEMWILPILDPDAANDYDDIMDALVPKDTDVQTIDLDTGAADTSPFWEPGEADWSKLLDIGLRPRRLYHKHEWKTIASPGGFLRQDTETPFNNIWLPTGEMTIRVKRRLRVSQPSVLVLAVGSPSLDDTTITPHGHLLENEWGRVKYAGDMLKQAHMDLIGLTEAGAETPWEEATDLLQKHLMPDMVEITAGSYATQTWTVVTEAVIDHSVKGELGVGTISIT